ncbi:DUF4163 domain-containing protein [Sporolactobacillus shoreicorticis]|uniref:PdaC/SigV domain-containing protein n=1 Tax=Sporolactobacillus shoreicorticis TaxID=1923877 RepID=A0ABW5S2K9_9BACL|nr:DUF4163 domain-containing protein [Sporolactobacillus shoreicorticis]MCO7125440.1 DUF4163 domain-containing protein [Sporolactobacillus shoreicorticis]
MNRKHRKYLILLPVCLIFLIPLIFFVSKTANDQEKNRLSENVRFTRHYYNGERLLLYPQVYGISKKAADKINAVLEKAAQSSYKTAYNLKKAEQICKKKNKKCNYSYNTSFRFMYHKNGKLSLLYNDYLYTGGPGGALYVTAFNFDLSTGKQYEIKDIIKTSYKKVQKYAFDYMRTHEPYSHYVTQLSDVPVNKDTQFMFYDDSIFLVFQDDVIKPYPEGAPDGDPFIKIPKSVYE